MSRDNYPAFVSIVDTEQTITREINLVADGDRFDFQANYRGGTFRPKRIKLYYRVNRGSANPFWYLFQIRITGGKVLKDGRVSDAYASQTVEKFYPERAPEWAWEIGADLLPRVEVERLAHRGASGV